MSALTTKPLPPLPATASLTAMTEYVLPTHANALGTVFGGQVLAWIDLCAAICAQRHSGSTVVTAEFDDVSFLAPIKVGQVVRLSGRVTATFRTSLEIFVEAMGEDTFTGASWPCATAFVTFVSVDDSFKPKHVRPLEIVTDQDRAFAAAATERRRARLSRRPQPPKPHA